MKINKYSLKFGMLLAIIYVIFFVAFMIMLNATESSPDGRGLGMIILVLVNIPLSLLLESFVEFLNIQVDSIFTSGALLLLSGIVQWSIVGSVIGWIYGKVKSLRGRIIMK